VVAQTILMLFLLAGAIIGAIVACATLFALVLSFVWTDKDKAATISRPRRVAAARRLPSGA
jgi:hypothetical protein